MAVKVSLLFQAWFWLKVVFSGEETQDTFRSENITCSVSVTDTTVTDTTVNKKRRARQLTFTIESAFMIARWR
jgi:hypothetical protein